MTPQPPNPHNITAEDPAEAGLSLLRAVLAHELEATGSLESSATGEDDAEFEVSALIEYVATCFFNRYGRDHGLDDLALSIDLFQQALGRRPPGHPSRPSTLNNLASAILERYECQGEASDLSSVIELYQEALKLRPTGNPLRSYSLNNLANVIFARYRQEEKESDLSYAIELHEEALELHSPGHPNRWVSLDNLSDLTRLRYQRTGKESDLTTTINLCKELLKLRPLGHPDRSTSLNNLANAIFMRYERNGGLKDLPDAIQLHREALQLRPTTHPNRSDSLNNLSTAVLSLYKQDGNESSLSEIVNMQREALVLHPSGHPHRPTSLNNLANALIARYERSGGEPDISEAIDLHREGLNLRPPGDPHRSDNLNNLAIALLRRFERDGGASDLSEAILLHQESLGLHPAGHPRRSVSLSSLANAKIIRYKWYGDAFDLSDAIDLHREALSLHGHGHSRRSDSLTNLGSALHARYRKEAVETDLFGAIELFREALELRPPGHPNRLTSLSNLATAFMTKFLQSNDISDLRTAVEFTESAIPGRLQTGHPRWSVTACLLATRLDMILRFASSFPDGGADLPSVEEIILLLRNAATSKTSSTHHRLQSSVCWIEIATERDPNSVLEAYRSAFTLLGSTMAVGQSLHARHTNFLSITGPFPTKDLAVKAARFALTGTRADPKVAVELLDQGRNLLLGSVGQFRVELSSVRRENPALAERFYRISRVLDSVVLTGEEIFDKISSHEDAINRYNRTSADWRAVVEEIRCLPGCESFLLPTSYEKLKEAAWGGPVIIILIGTERSTAIIVTAEDEPNTVDLPDATEEVIRALHEEWRGALETLPEESRVVRKLPDTLTQLWSLIVHPIVHVLTEVIHLPLQSRIWWYPTSWASFLPLHAAGSYKKGGQNVPDLYISSYTPTLQALRRARQNFPSPGVKENTCLLMVSQPKSEGQDELMVDKEVEVVQRLVQNTLLLAEDQASREKVLEEMRNPDHTWIHFACHGVPDPADPFQSHFSLNNGPLSLQDIITNDLSFAEFAYLSACHSAAQDITLPDEGLTLAGGMQFAGFKSVVGTLWKMADDDAPLLARIFYRGVAKKSEGAGGLDCTKTAEALHDAVKRLRERRVPLFRWVNLLENQIDQYATALETITTYIHTQSATLKRRLNESAFIHKSPVELFVEIILIELWTYTPSQHLHINSSRRHELAQVAKRWYDTILDAPKCWADIQFGNEQLSTSVLLRRSKNTSLAVQCLASDLDYGKAPGPKEFFDEVCRHSHQWQSLRIGGHGLSEDTVARCFQSPAPRLRDLCITLSRPPPVVHLQTGWALRHVMLDGVSISWDACPLADLLSFQLRNISNSIPTLDQLQDILLNSPSIDPAQTFVVIVEIPADMAEYLITTLRPATKCSLNLRVVVIDKTFVSTLFDFIGSSLRSTTSITIIDGLVDGVTLYTAFYPQTWGWSSWAVGNEECGVLVDLRSSNTPDLMRLVAKFVEVVGVTAEIRLFLCKYGLDIADTRTCFPVDALDHLPSTTEIIIHRHADATNVMAHLRNPRPPNGLWACPKLKELGLAAVMQGLTREAADDFKIGRNGDGNKDEQVLGRPPPLCIA